MNSNASIYSNLFNDVDLVKKIQKKLPELFLLAEVDNSRNGKLGMEIGSARERILIALLIYKFGEELVNADTPITSSEVDVIVQNEPLSIKTISGKRIGGVKLIWTVDPEKAKYFADNFVPECDLLLVHINWGGMGCMYLFQKHLQISIMNKIGRDRFFKLPKQGTNPRGVEISQEAIRTLVSSGESLKIEIPFKRVEKAYNAYERWVEYWNEAE